MITFADAAYIVGMTQDDSARVRSNDSLDDCDDYSYPVSTEQPDRDHYNDTEANEEDES